MKRERLRTFDVFYTRNLGEKERVFCAQIKARDEDDAERRLKTRWKTGDTRQEIHDIEEV